MALKETLEQILITRINDLIEMSRFRKTSLFIELDFVMLEYKKRSGEDSKPNGHYWAALEYLEERYPHLYGFVIKK